MGYLENYNTIRDAYRKYLSRSQSQKILDMSRDYSRRNAFHRAAAASDLRTGFRQGFNYLRNTGTQNSGEAARLKRKLGAQFTYTNDQLKKNELALLGQDAENYKSANQRAWAELEKERRAREMLKKSGQRGIAGGAGRYYAMTK